MSDEWKVRDDKPMVIEVFTKRDLFAALAMQRLIDSDIEVPAPTASWRTIVNYADNVARGAVIFADALIEGLNKED